MAPKKEEKEEVVKIKTSKKPLAPTNAAIPVPRKKVADMKPVPASQQANADAFLKKLKASAHEPLPQPVGKKQGGWSGAVTAAVGLALLISAGAAAYYFVIMPRGEETPAPEFPSVTQDNLSVRVEAEQIGMGGATTISYTLTGDSGSPVLYLVNADNTLVGRIAEIPAGTSSFKWNPQDVRSEDGATIEAPQPGSYRILLALRPEGDTRPATELDKRAVSAPFALSYDALETTGEIAFETCLAIGGYGSEQWYEALEAAATAQGFSLDTVTTSCYSPDGGILVMISSGEGLMGYPRITRFTTEEGLLREAVYVGVRDEELPGNPATFGRRSGTTIPIIVNGVTTYTYDFAKNIFEPVE